MDDNSDMYESEKNIFTDSSYQVTENQSIPVYADVQTYPCSNCGRCFNVESLRKHQPVCKKTTQKQPRKVFDTGKQRATNSDVPYTATKETTQFYKDGTKPKNDTQKKHSNNWREGHNELVRTIRQARQVTRAIETGAPLPKPIPAQIPNDYIQCEYCQRHFNKYSAERHIPFCETQFKRKQIQPNPRTPPTKPQISSAPSTLVSRRPQKTTNEKDYRRPPLNPNLFKRPIFNTPVKNPASHTPPKQSSYRMAKTRSAAGNYLPGMMRTGRTAENGDLNSMAAAGRGQTKGDAQPRTPGVRTRSPSPARRAPQTNGGTPPQKVRPPIVSTAAKHCHECGEAFPVDWAKFCCECGEKRLGME